MALETTCYLAPHYMYEGAYPHNPTLSLTSSGRKVVYLIGHSHICFGLRDIIAEALMFSQYVSLYQKFETYRCQPACALMIPLYQPRRHFYKL